MHWWPVCDGYLQHNGNSSIFVHDIVGVEKQFVHSMTIDTSVLNSTNTKSIALYVNAISAGSPMTINEFKNRDINVDVYTHHVDQDPTYSIYGPTYTFSIKNAQRSANPDAPFWHVFNLVKQGGVYVVQEPVSTSEQTSGSIVTDICSIRGQMPLDTSKCRP